MIIPPNASGKLVLVDLIPSTALLGSVSVTLQNNRRFKGIHLVTNCTAVAGAGTYRPQIVSYVGTVGNTILLPSFSTFIGVLSFIIYPGVGTGPSGATATFDEGCLSESMLISLVNSSAGVGNEVTIGLSATLLE